MLGMSSNANHNLFTKFVPYWHCKVTTFFLIMQVFERFFFQYPYHFSTHLVEQNVIPFTFWTSSVCGLISLPHSAQYFTSQPQLVELVFDITLFNLSLTYVIFSVAKVQQYFELCKFSTNFFITLRIIRFVPKPFKFRPISLVFGWE